MYSRLFRWNQRKLSGKRALINLQLPVRNNVLYTHLIKILLSTNNNYKVISMRMKKLNTAKGLQKSSGKLRLIAKALT
jgi:hypothetical protein